MHQSFFYFSGCIFKYSEFGVIVSCTEKVEEFFVVQFQKRDTDRIFLDFVTVQLLKELVA